MKSPSRLGGDLIHWPVLGLIPEGVPRLQPHPWQVACGGSSQVSQPQLELLDEELLEDDEELLDEDELELLEDELLDEELLEELDEELLELEELLDDRLLEDELLDDELLEDELDELLRKMSTGMVSTSFDGRVDFGYSLPCGRGRRAAVAQLSARDGLLADDRCVTLGKNRRRVAGCSPTPAGGLVTFYYQAIPVKGTNCKSRHRS